MHLFQQHMSEDENTATKEQSKAYTVPVTTGAVFFMEILFKRTLSAGCTIDVDGIDAVEAMIERSGCMKQYTLLNDCYLTHHDWRRCQEEVRNWTHL